MRRPLLALVGTLACTSGPAFADCASGKAACAPPATAETGSTPPAPPDEQSAHADQRRSDYETARQEFEHLRTLDRLKRERDAWSAAQRRAADAAVTSGAGRTRKPERPTGVAAKYPAAGPAVGLPPQPGTARPEQHEVREGVRIAVPSQLSAGSPPSHAPVYVFGPKGLARE